MKAGEKIREFRKKKGFTQKELAEKIGYAQGFLAEIEKGKKEPSREFLKKLNEIFGVSTDYILYSETGTQWEKIETILKEEGMSEENVQDIKGHYIGGLHFAAHAAREKEDNQYATIRDPQAPYRTITPEQKKLVVDMIEILDSDDEVTISALKGNIQAFLEAVRAKKNNKTK